MSDQPRRRLAAIMFADMVGYTALMQRDERSAHAERDRHRAILTRVVSSHHGQVLEYYGDGTLSIFSSAVEAVECAVEVQRALTLEPLIPLRVGVHTGDVVQDESGIYGDGVNVAARIQDLAAPGGVMISGKVFDEIKNHPELRAVPIGAVQVKNVGYLLNVFAISNEGMAVPTGAEVRDKVEAGGHGLYVPPGGASGADGTPLPRPPMGVGEAIIKGMRDRAVVQWSLVYLACAWVFLSVVRFAGERLGWSPQLPQNLGVLAFLGFLATAVVAWHHGEKGRQPVRRSEVALLIALLVAGVVALSVIPPADGMGDPVVQLASAAMSRDPRPSVAALPWANRSGQPEDAYFADGIHDEILTRLSKVAGLRVISRQSVMQFRDSQLPTARIASELGVRYILEAALLRVRDTVRISVQLIDAQSDHVAWAVTHDRELTMENLLALQSEIAQVIADTLRAAVTADERSELRRGDTNDLRAYDYFLQGRAYYLRPGYLEENFDAARDLFERAIALDPGFAPAHAALSLAHGQLYWEGFDRTAERLAAQQAAAGEALRLDPTLGQAHQAIGWMHFVRGSFEEALAHYSMALETMPNDAAVVASVGYSHRRLGHWPAVFASFERAVALSPRDATLIYDLGGHSFAITRRYADAMRAYNTALALAPDLHDAALRKGYTWLHWRGELDTLRAVVRGFPASLQTLEVDKARLDLALFERDGDAVLRILGRTPSDVIEMQLVYAPESLYAAWAHRLRGDEGAARTAFDSARVHLEDLRRRRPEDARVLAALGFAYAGLGRPADAARAAEASLAANVRQGSVLTREQSIEASARILAQAGLADRAVGRLGELLESLSPVSVLTLRLDPLYDPIRGTAAFRTLVDRVDPPVPPDA